MGSLFGLTYFTHGTQIRKGLRPILCNTISVIHATRLVNAIKVLSTLGTLSVLNTLSTLSTLSTVGILSLMAAIHTLPAWGNSLHNDTNETLGIVTAVSNGCLLIQGDPLTENALSEVIVTIDGTTVYDLMTGLAVKSDDITEGTQVRVAYGPPLADTEPPVAPADIVWLNYGVEGAAIFQTAVSGNIRYGDGYCAFISDDGNYRVTLAPDTLITDMDGTCLTPEDIQPGMTLFLWADLVTASLPAQAYPERAVLIYSVTDYDACDAGYDVDYDADYDVDCDFNDYDVDYDVTNNTDEWYGVPME